MKVFEHEHPLNLIDLHQEYPPYEDEDEDEDDQEDGFIKKEKFRCACDRCGEEIHMYHRYYYTCKIDTSCHFSLHKFCAEVVESFKHPSHQHALILGKSPIRFGWNCSFCFINHMPKEIHYRCRECNYYIDLNCAVEVGKRIIHHPCHPHLLMCAITKPILCKCNACGKEHKGIFYQCTTCAGFTIHHDCVFLPNKVLIQQTTDDAFYHTHPLTISYSFTEIEQKVKHDPRCRVCGLRFHDTKKLWIYKCDDCIYYAHVDCATSRSEPFMSIFLRAGVGKTIKNFKDVDHPRLVHLPFPDASCSLPKHLFFKDIESTTFRIDKVNLTHVSHQHPLILVDQTQCNDSNSIMLLCHSPMKKTQLLCNGCVRPIMSTMPFYKCPKTCCNFVLHEWCTRLPTEIENHPGHPQHTLVLKPNVPFELLSVFYCSVCRLPCNGFAYCCVDCKYYVDVSCGCIPKEITHKAHPNHLLSIVQNPSSEENCHMCLQNDYITIFPDPLFSFSRFMGIINVPRLPYDNLKIAPKQELVFRCNDCDIWIHPECALLPPETIRHKHDKHPMHLSYLPIENHRSEYFCEICEDDLDPHASFYHCQDCGQSIHASCAPLILNCETSTFSHYRRAGIYYFLNIKFGGIHNTNSHPHPLSFAQGIESDGRCSKCLERLQYKMIFKCHRCEFAIDYHCCSVHYKI